MATAMRGRVRALRTPQSLGARLVLILTVPGAAGAVGIALLLATIIVPSFGRLERRTLNVHVERTDAALAAYAERVERAARYYGDRDAGGMMPPALADIGVDGMAYVGDDGRVAAARGGDPAGEARLAAAVVAVNVPRVLAANTSAGFYVRSGGRIVAIGAARVRHHAATHGYLVMARELDSSQLSAMLGLDAVVDTVSAPRPAIEPAATRMTIVLPIAGADGRAVGRVRFVIPREVSALGRRLLLLATAGTVLLLLIVLVALRRMIGRQVLAPLARVERHMEWVRVSGSLSPLEEEERHDEIGSLGRSFNAMLSQLRDLREQIEVQSFALGRSESAVAVMHNVRNALSPISTIISHGLARPAPVDRELLARAAAELAQGDLPAERRRTLAAFVTGGVAALEAARAEQVAQLAIGRSALVQVLDIIGQQQGAAHERPDLSVCDVVDIVAQNATIALHSGPTRIAFRYPGERCAVIANRVILSQVIGNLFANATEAVTATGRGAGAIVVTVAEDDGVVTVRIADDGEGFDPAAAPMLFQRGFSTRAHKSGGLGLHWCANSMAAMDGSLRLESAGPGFGAAAVLTLRAGAAENAISAAAA